MDIVVSGGGLALSQKDIDRFWSMVDRTGECWLWLRGTSKRGYGQFKLGKKMARANRVSYLLATGELPDLNICHTCDTPGCVRPAHLFPGTHQQNQADKVAKGRQARGDRHGARLHPETRPRGEAHGFHKHPERIARGERNGNAILTNQQRGEIKTKYRAGNIRQVDLAMEYGVGQACISSVIRSKDC